MRALIERMTLAMCLLWTVAAWPPATSAEPAVVAMITAVKGKVTVQDKPADMLTELHVGDRVTVSAEGASTLSFASAGIRVYLKGGARVTVGVRGVAPPGPLVRTEQPQARQGLALPAGVNIQRMMAVPMSRGREEPNVALLTQKSMLAGMPVSWWVSDARPSKQTLRVYRGKKSPGSLKEAVFVKADLAPDVRSLQLPTGLLKPGEDGYLEIALEFPSTPELLDQQPVHVLSTADARSLASARAEADRELAAQPHDPTPRILLMYRYLDAHLNELALPLAERLEQDDPRNVRLLQTLQHIYDNLGMSSEVKKVDDRIKALSPP